MNASSLAACLKEISSDRRRAVAHERMVKVWLTVAAALVIYALGTRLFEWDAPWVIPTLLVGGIIAWIAVKRSVAKLNVSLLDIAREVEANDARLNSLLLAAYEEQEKAGPEGLSYLQERVVVEALEANRRSPWGQQYSERRFFKGLRHAGSFAVFVVCLVVAVLVGPRGAILTRLLGGVEVSPGSQTVEKGTMLSIMAKFPEPVPAEARLIVHPKSGPLQSLAMDRPLADPIFGAVIPEVNDEFKYHVEYRGKKTAEYQVTVFEYPRLNRADAHLKFPEFTGLSEKKIDDTRRVSAVEGTTVNLRLQLNKDVKSAAFVRKGAEPLPLVRDQQFSNVYHVKIDLKESQKLTLALKDADGRTNKLLSEFTLDALPNKEPELKIVFPRGDQRVSAIEEVSLNAEVKDDFGLGSYGLAFSLGGDEPKYLKLGDKGTANEKKALAHLLKVEELAAKQDQLISYFAWAEDLGPDGQVRRSESDMYFAEVRPFEEIFRQGSGNQQQEQQQQQGGGQQSPSEQLGELQKQIINATWKIQRTESKEKPSPKFKNDATTVRDSQDKALSMAEELAEKLPDPRLKALADAATTEMKKALDKLSDAVSQKSPGPLPEALSAERAAYQALLRLQAKEYSVSRQRQQGGGGGGAQQRAQRQLDELDLQEENDRYERQSQASAGKSPEQQEQMQVLNQLKDLARRQNDVNEQLKELQAALQEAKTEKEKEELRRQLKRLQEEQQELVQDMDALNQKMAQSKNSEVADSRQQLEKAREQGQKASEQMGGENSLGQAASAGARTENDLKKLTEDFRKATAQQFNDEMRDMRREARELADKEKEIANKLDEMKNPKQRQLSDGGVKDELARQLGQQKTNYSNILDRMKKVSEQAETAEPLLSQKLYETVRELNQQDTAQTLDQASEFLKRSFVQQAGQLEEKARKNIDTLAKGVDQAADRLLGDEAEALRNAARQLDTLTQRLRNEAARAGIGGTNGTNAGAFAGGSTNVPPQSSRTNQLAGAGGGSTNGVGTNALSRTLAQRGGRGQQRDPNSQQQGDGSQQAGENGNQPGEGERQLAQNSNQQGQRGERGQRGEGQQPGQQNGERGQQGQDGQQGEGQQGQQASNQQGQGQGQGEGQGQEGQQASNQQGQQGQQGQGGNSNDGGRRNFFDELARGSRNAGAASAGSGPAGVPEGPITGTDFRSWADQLRDVQEMIDEPDLRNRVAQVLDQARQMRADYVRHSKNPQWNLLQNQVLTPLVEVRQRIAEELARRDASQVAPLDRDPVPGRYAELVSRYYQSLGQGAPVQKPANPPKPQLQ